MAQKRHETVKKRTEMAQKRHETGIKRRVLVMNAPMDVPIKARAESPTDYSPGHRPG